MSYASLPFAVEGTVTAWQAADAFAVALSFDWFAP
jgi:hypothetical protein